ncbi:LTA synthase family protein [Streptococcus parasuis]|uniref:LTA synthase family protein n=1 Tax=Streptococcus parasuis TaxID=1501662 RepID=UPI0023792BB1|nr:LTA synthase family protein [Streptococcus parasuis]WDN59340.1 LTA synthase family protein [Streptococcus parasuis]WDN61173.1 LTA synthase family protein [Streptococcus parasuis]
MKLIKLFFHWIIVILLGSSFIKYIDLIENELGVANNNGNVRIIAEETQQYIDGIQINGKYNLGEFVVRNDWYTVSQNVVNTFYISEIENNVMEFNLPTPIKSISFEYRVSDEPKIIHIYIDDKLIKTLDTSIGKDSKNLFFLETAHSTKLSSENQFWYIQIIILFMGLIFYALGNATWRIRFRDIILVLCLIGIQFFLTSKLFPLLYRDELVLFNSSFNKAEINLLLTTFTLTLYASFIGYRQLNNKLFVACKNLFILFNFASVPILSLFIIENSYSQFSTLSIENIRYNLIIISVLFFIVFLMTNFRFASIFILSISAIIGISNQILITSRGTPLLFYNIFQIKDALNVASSITITLNNRMLQSIFFTLFLNTYFSILPKLTLPNFFPKAINKTKFDFKWFNRFIRITIGYLAITLVLPTSIQSLVDNADITLDYWKMQVTYGQYGLPLSLVSFYEDSKISKPEGYSTSNLEQLLETYSSDTDTSTTKPNIIFIQNESQSDFSTLQNLSISPDPLLNQHTLSDNTVHGTLNVSVYGGGTANTEYEVLTSNAISFLSSNLFPYQQIITQERPSFASYLKDKDYDTVALHPQSGNNYNRQKVYPLLGFTKSYFLDSDPAISELAPLTIDRSWPSDQFLFNGIKELYEQKGDTPLFSFVVTMQGHGGYLNSEETYPREVNINGSTSEYLAETEFLTSLKKTDEAFADLITYFSSYKEPTVIVMYGDHQPSLSQEFYSQFMDESNPASKYSTPFVIWANFDINEREAITISPNYLVPYLMNILSESEYALPRSPYQQFVSDMQLELPIITSWGNLDGSGKQIEDLSNLSLYQTYLQLEYNSAVDKRPLEDLFK